MRVATDEQIQSALFLLSKVKHANNVSNEQDARAFFSIHIRVLRGFTIEAIREGIDYFCFEDPRDEKIKGLFPQPDELKKSVVDATASILWRRDQGKKLMEQPAAIKKEPAKIEPPKNPILEKMSKAQVVKACQIFRNNLDMTFDQACAQVLETV